MSTQCPSGKLEIEVTPDMIGVGVASLERHFGCDHLFDMRAPAAVRDLLSECFAQAGLHIAGRPPGSRQ